MLSTTDTKHEHDKTAFFVFLLIYSYELTSASKGVDVMGIVLRDMDESFSLYERVLAAVRYSKSNGVLSNCRCSIFLC